MLSSTENHELMTQARQRLQGNWGIAIGFYLLLMIINYALGCIPAIGTIASMVLSGPFSLGACIFFLAISRGHEKSISMLFAGFENFGTAFCAYFLTAIYTLLWMLLFIIPGIIAAYRYSQTFFIIANDKSISASEAIARSKEMMDGNKWKFFCLNCRFIGWALLCILTLGIGILWLGPYMFTSISRFHDDVSGGYATVPVEDN
jgi:uncharacterized membrane protein